MCKVHCDRLSDERLEGGFIKLSVLGNVYRPPSSTGEAGIEQARWILERRTAVEGEFDLVLVGLARADEPRMLPGWNSERVRGLAPFHLLDDLWIGLLDESANAREHGAAPIAKRRDLRIDLLRGRCHGIAIPPLTWIVCPVT